MDRPSLASAPLGISPWCVLCPAAVGGSSTKLWESFSTARPPLPEGSALGVIYEGCGSPATLWLLVMNFKSSEYFVLAGEGGEEWWQETNRFLLVIPLATATLFLTNLIKNYTTLCFLESVLLSKYKTNQRVEKCTIWSSSFCCNWFSKTSHRGTRAAF